MRGELQLALDLAKTLPSQNLPEFLGELETVRITALSRIAAPAVETREDRLLDITETAARMHVSNNYLYRHSARLPFSKRIGRKLLFSSAGLDLYLKRAR